MQWHCDRELHRRMVDFIIDLMLLRGSTSVQLCLYRGISGSL
ncbi:hypothetical protein NHE_0182 [Neorickettsia helminthoeca str. Oregon]|uniref:Uncharacterized protein n=1 Tax=Neorickettsia helminthoeca str. Oregon TaxID=1286528 RepID=X5GVQ5_9RICK|nr:hypothetical protein NHE_0182 [Neorickettsia helminthoeca str. Oregon]